MSKIYLPDSFSFTICHFFHNAMRQMATIRTTTTTPTIPLRAEAMRTIGTSVVGLMAVASVKSVDRAADEIQKKNIRSLTVCCLTAAVRHIHQTYCISSYNETKSLAMQFRNLRPLYYSILCIVKAIPRPKVLHSL